MKEYERQIFWLEYFDSALKRSEGRRVPLSSATREPTLSELSEACRRLNLQPQPQTARFPSLSSKESGYVSVAKSTPKQALLLRVARELSVVRGLAAKRQPQKQPGRRR
ncbi:MAG: signal recognition particle protein Srp19 [Nitrososphaerota archaeon]|nr:signal recognition particle protein Srp19 [Nitrososphaerota archaeon]MDG7023384.1 signal recognition particle protein Srp19 [Nitrososphaerota archaeon]